MNTDNCSGTIRPPFKTLGWEGGIDGHLVLLDQRKLPHQVFYLATHKPAQLFEAIQTLAVRGAPAIGVAAAYGICLGLKELPSDTAPADAIQSIEQNVSYLASSRPTAVNLFWALNRMQKAAVGYLVHNPSAGLPQLQQTMLEEAMRIEQEDCRMCDAIGQHGMSLVPDRGGVLTHCNAGALATAGIGTALAPLYAAHAAGKRFTVYADETRPLLQGARLTAWELGQAGIKTVLICDNMAASLMKQGKIQAVIVGADRIAANGDTANKIGTLGVSILAARFGVPFYVAAPSSTFDLTIADGSRIPIEQRHSDEVRILAGKPIAPPDSAADNPAFDITDAKDISAIITEKGIIRRPDTESIRAIIRS